MAVYTDLSRETVSQFLLDNYSLGELVSLEGIPEGIQNTNYYLETLKGRFVFTLVERRTPERDLPYFLNYMSHLATTEFPCPQPIPTLNGDFFSHLADKPAIIVTFLNGKFSKTPSPRQCFEAGRLIARLHLAGEGFKETRENLFSLKALEAMFIKMASNISAKWPGLENMIEKELIFQKVNQPMGLPQGPIHTDIFPDNVLYEGNKTTGLIDFFFSCTDTLVYDLAIALGCWAFDGNGKIKTDHFLEMIKGYETERPLLKIEKEALPVLLRKSSLAFLLTRTEDVLHPPRNVLGVQKDPGEYRKILETQQKKLHIKEYF